MRGGRVVNPFGRKVCSMRSFRRSKHAEIDAPAVYVYPSLPFVRAVVPAHANIPTTAAPVWLSLIVRVFLVGHNSKVGKAVIRPNAIDMVNLAIREAPMHKRPNYSVRLVHLFAVAKLHIAMCVKTLCLPSGAGPRQNASLGVVGKRLPKVFYVNGRHDEILAGVNYYAGR